MDFEEIIKQIGENADLVQKAKNIHSRIFKNQKRNRRSGEVHGIKKIVRKIVEVTIRRKELNEFKMELKKSEIPIDSDIPLTMLYHKIIFEVVMRNAMKKALF